MNPGVALPHQTIIPVRRAEGSGDTFIFTQFLDFSADKWENNPGYGTDHLLAQCRRGKDRDWK